MGIIAFYPEKEDYYVASFPNSRCKEEFIAIENFLLTMCRVDLIILRELRKNIKVRKIKKRETEEFYLNNILAPAIYKVLNPLREKKFDFKDDFFYVHINGKNFYADSEHLNFSEENSTMIKGKDRYQLIGFLKVKSDKISISESIKIFHQKLCLDDKVHYSEDDLLICKMSDFSKV